MEERAIEIKTLSPDDVIKEIKNGEEKLNDVDAKNAAETKSEEKKSIH